MFVGSFHNGLEAEHFHESLAQKPTYWLVNMVTRVECYIKSEESNVEKKACNIRKCVTSVEGTQHSRNNYPSPFEDKAMFKQGGKVVKGFTPLNTTHK